MTMLSVIIPTINRSPYLKRTLESIVGQIYPMTSFEVIVIDNGSTDNTKEVAELFNQRIMNLRYYYAPAPGLHVGRHLGMRMANSDILVYADDDIEAFPTWLETIAENFKNPEVALVGGKDLPKFESEPPQWIQKLWEKDNDGNRYLGYLSIIDLGDAKKEINPRHVFGCNFSIRKSILLEAGGFHPDAMPEDMIHFRGDGESHISKFIERKQYKTVYHPHASVYHNVPKERLTEKYFCKRAYLQGISDSYSCLRNGRNPSRFRVGRIMNLLRSPGFQWVLLSDKRQRHIANAYRQGFLMHQHEASRDASLYYWIMKEHYRNESPG